MASFATQLTPRLSDLESRLSALEASLLVLTDGVFTKWTVTIDIVTGATDVVLDPKPLTLFTVNVSASSPVPCSSGTLEVLGSASLPPGFYRSYGAISFTSTNNGTTPNGMLALVASALSQSSSSLPSQKNFYTTTPGGGNILPVDWTIPLPDQFIDLTSASGNTTLYLQAKANFAGGVGGATTGAYGFCYWELIPS